MLKLLFDLDFWYDMATFAIVILLIILAIKVKGFRIFVLAVLYLAIVVSAVFSYFKINEYYKAEGGVVGTIKSISEYNKVENNDLIFDFKNVVMTENGKVDSAGNVVGYSAKFTSECVPKFVDGQVYQPYVNGSPVDVSEFSTDLLVANYEYNFYDEDQNLILNDTLKFRFAFYKQSTSFIVSTEGGAYACKQWNYFFNKNGFIVELKPVEEKDDVESFLSQFIKVELTLTDGEITQSLQTYYFKQSGMLPLDLEFGSYRYNITGWIDIETSEPVDISTTTFTKDTKLQAVYDYKKYNISLTHFSGPNDTTTKVVSFIGGDLFKLREAPSNADYLFVGYSLDNATLLSSDYRIVGEKTIDVIWKSKITKNEAIEYFIKIAFNANHPYSGNVVKGAELVSFDSFKKSTYYLSGKYLNCLTFNATYYKGGTLYENKIVNIIAIINIENWADNFLNNIYQQIESIEKMSFNNTKLFNFDDFKVLCDTYNGNQLSITLGASRTPSSDTGSDSSAGGGFGGAGGSGR